MWLEEEAPSFDVVDQSSVDGLDVSAAEDKRRLLAASTGDAAATDEAAMDLGYGAAPDAAKTTAIAGLTAAAAGALSFTEHASIFCRSGIYRNIAFVEANLYYLLSLHKYNLYNSPHDVIITYYPVGCLLDYSRIRSFLFLLSSLSPVWLSLNQWLIC